LEEGLVIKSTGSWYTVKHGSKTTMCKIKGKFRIKEITTTNPVTVGDIVKFKTTGDSDDIGIITGIRERKNYIIRKASNFSKEAHLIAANVDQAFLMFTIDFPETPLEFIDRFLITAEAYHIPTILLINKLDLYNEDVLKKLAEIKKTYNDAGYECYEISAIKKKNISIVSERMKNKISVISGNSGVGKSTLINAIDKNINIKVAEISSYHKTGKHTTAYSEMYELEKGGYIIDTPGIKGFGLIDLEENEVGLFFPEIFKLSKHCQYYNCSHTHEPGCGVKVALEKGILSKSRYRSYINILNKDKKKYRTK
jgi:ribosome biogenesis GTPase